MKNFPKGRAGMVVGLLAVTLACAAASGLPHVSDLYASETIPFDWDRRLNCPRPQKVCS